MQERGGKRAGAGRPIGSKSDSTILAMEMRKEIVATVQSELRPLLGALLDAAKGHKIKTKGGSVYSKCPDVRAIGYLLDQALGKAKLVEEITTDEGLMIMIKGSNTNKEGPSSAKPTEHISSKL